MLKRITPDNEAHWLELREPNINSTEVAALFGMSPYLTAYELYHLKTGNIDDNFQENSRSKAGKFLEESIAKYALNELKCEGRPMKDYFFDDETRMGSSFDWEITSGPMEGWILEIKNVDSLVYRDKWLDDEAPDHIEVQVQHQMALTKAPGTVIAAMVGGNELKFIYRERDIGYGDGLINAINEFWTGVASGNEPEPDYGTDADVIIRLHQAAGHETYDATNDLITTELMKEYKQLSVLYKEVEDQRKEKKAQILDVIGNDVLKVLGGEGLTLSCAMTKSSEGTPITQDMVGNLQGGRKSYRNFRINQKKQK